MPKFFVHAPAGLFTTAVRPEVAAALTDLGMVCEGLADRPEVRAGVWVVFAEHPADGIFQGGRIGPEPAVALVVYALQGGLDDEGRRRLIAEATSLLRGKAAAPSDAPPRIYVVIHDMPEASWGMAGLQVKLASLR